MSAKAVEVVPVSVPDSSGPLLELCGVAAGYGRILAIRDVDMQVSAGEVVCLLGRNGAGKSTTLSAISGLLSLKAGSVLFGGEDVSRLPAHRRARLGLHHLPEGRSVFRGLTVSENLRLVRDRKVDPFEIFPELAGISGRRARVLSGGEQQMLALARILAARPRAVLVDELSLGLAPQVVERILPLLRAAADRDGTAIVLVEQHLARGLACADRAYVLQHGRIVLNESASTVLKSPELLERSYL